MMRHVFGLSRVIEHGKAHNFKSELEKCIVINLLPSIITRCYLENETCHLLCQEPWLSLFRREAEQMSGEKREALEYMLNSAPIFQLVVKCSAFIMSQDTHGQRDALRRGQILGQLAKSAKKFFDWCNPLVGDSVQLRESRNGMRNAEPQSDTTKWHEDLRGFCQQVTLIHHRLYVALGGDDSVRIEQQLQRLAEQLRLMHESQANNPQFRKPFALSSAITAILGTAEEWSRFSISASANAKCKKQALATPTMFRDWATQMGITIE
ncbi:hypothetical protein NLG97_g4395 [Lecanicillium saksenae]|uniref:Uncharacterized protein n=1 Tax=Lecanicillium saksenae TaxID=468837 RepID=A0ACC1QX88_9HYPO|nr:hypothetical protein NLG97_g4395 [Lecanicillium saksenae]